MKKVKTPSTNEAAGWLSMFLPVTGYLLVGAVPLGVERAFLQRDVSWLCLQLLIVCRVDCDRIALCLRESEVGRSLSALYCHVQGLHGLQLVHQLVHQALRSCPSQITDNSLCLITKKVQWHQIRWMKNAFWRPTKKIQRRLIRTKGRSSAAAMFVRMTR